MATGTAVYDASFSVSSASQIVTGGAAVGTSYFAVNSNYIYRTALTTIGLNGFTNCMWIFMTSHNLMNLGSIGGPAAGPDGVYYQINNASSYLALNSASGYYGPQSDASNTVITTWTHHAYTITSSNIVLHYQDGILTSSPTNTGFKVYPFTNNSYSNGCCFGAVYAGTSGQYMNSGTFVGGIDDFRVYTRALSASDIYQIYNKTG